AAGTGGALRLVRSAHARTRSRDARRRGISPRGDRERRDVHPRETRGDCRGARPTVSRQRKAMTAPSLRTIVKRALEGETKLSRTTRVLLAVSGGPDSMALLDAMADLASSFDLRLVAHGIDHGLRKSAAAELD